MSKSTFSWEGRPVNPTRLRDFARDLKTREEASCLRMLLSRAGISPDGWSGRTFPAFCLPGEDGISLPSSGRWQNAGMGSPTAFLTLSTSEHADTLGPSRNGGAVCSLSDILETGDVPRRYYLTAKACRGILRRAEKRGKVLPPQLARALQAVAGSEPTSTSTEG